MPWFGVLNVDGSLHPAGTAQFRPMAGTEIAVRVCEFRRALCLAHGQVQVVMFLVVLVAGFDFFRGLNDLADARRGCQDDGETKNRETENGEPGNSSFGLAGHVHAPPEWSMHQQERRAYYPRPASGRAGFFKGENRLFIFEHDDGNTAPSRWCTLSYDRWTSSLAMKPGYDRWFLTT